MKKRNRNIIITVILLLLVASVTMAAVVIIPSADELLTQSLETLEGVTDGHAVVEVTMDLPTELMGEFSGDLPSIASGETLNGTFELWGKFGVGPEGEPAMRLEVLDASKVEMVGVTAVSDGSQFWLYDPSRNIVVVGRAEEMGPLLAEKMSDYEGEWEHDGDFDPESMDATHDMPQSPADAVAKLLEYFTAERNGQEQIAGTDAYLLRLIPIPEKMPEELRLAGGYVNLWLRTTDQLPLAVEYAESAIAYGKAEALQVEINTDLDESIFTFDIPEGVEVIEATDFLAQMEAQKYEDSEALDFEALDFEALTPTDLPENATAAEIQQMGKTMIQRFNLPDGRSFVVAQGGAMPLDAPAESNSTETVIVRGVEATLFTNDETTRTLLAWNEGEIFFLVGGDLTPDQALAIAESLQ